MAARSLWMKWAITDGRMPGLAAVSSSTETLPVPCARETSAISWSWDLFSARPTVRAWKLSKVPRMSSETSE